LKGDWKHNYNDNDHDDVVVMAPGATSATTQQARTVLQFKTWWRKNARVESCAAELEMRNVMRTNKRRKVKVKTLQRENSDEDFQRQQTAVLT
jgi:hypothetical protein